MGSLDQTADGQQAAGGMVRRAQGAPLLVARGISKHFGAIAANNAVNLTINKGEIHALLGENGAGKSTLVKILYGALQPDAGTIEWDGRQVRINSPAAARQLGIGMVFQHFSLFEALSVVENIALALPKPGSMRELAARIEKVSREYGLPLDPHALVADLPVGIRQRIEIVRCLLQAPRLIIMDEPTSVLTPQEADELFVTLKRLADEGCAVLYISHRLDEVRRICHHATILRHGRFVRECDPALETPASIARMMVGADVSHVTSSGALTGSGPVRLAVRNLATSPLTPFSVPLAAVNLDVRAGEVVAIAGVAGNGQGELFDAISGERRSAPGMVEIDGTPCGNESVTRRRQRGAAFVPEERLGHGAVPGMRLSHNIILTRHSTGDDLVRSGFAAYGRAGEMEKHITRAYDIRMSHDDPEARSLSGGNLQKFVVGRELSRSPGILVVNQPTWGVDAGAAALIRQCLLDLARKGSAVLVISQDLDEIYEIADRIAVISRGHLSPAEPASTMTLERIGLLMAGDAEKPSSANQSGEGA